MKYILYILLFFITLKLSANLPPWFDDKAQHFYAGFAISIASAEVCNQITDRPALSALGGFLLGTAAGIAKEAVYDKMMNKGKCSNLDAGMTSYGAATGAMCIRVKFDICDKQKDKQLEKLEQQKYNSL